MLLGQVIVDDFAEAQCQIRDDVAGFDDFEHGQVGHGRERMRRQLERCGARPCALHLDVLHVVAHQFADARGGRRAG